MKGRIPYVTGAAALAFAISLPAAVKPAPAAPGRAISFSRQIQPIFDDNCVACHQSGSAQQGLNLEQGQSRGAIVGKQSHESPNALIVPRDPGASYLLAKVKGTQRTLKGAGARMPLGGALSPAEIALIEQWIAAGAPQN